MADLNPNRANNSLVIENVSPGVNVVDPGVSNIVVAQLGNLISLQFVATVQSPLVTDPLSELIVQTVLTTSDALVDRMDPGSGEKMVSCSVYNTFGPRWENAVVLVSKVSNKIRFHIKPPPGGWAYNEDDVNLNISGSQIEYMAQPVSGRDYVPVIV